MAKAIVGLNGFGRIGRAFTRIALERGSFDIAVINTRKTPVAMMAYLLQYDSLYRKYGKEVKVDGNNLIVGDKRIAVTQGGMPSEVPWGSYGVNVVVDATGAFEKKEELEGHLHDGVQKVILTSPSKDEVTPHVVLGVNDETFPFAEEAVISNASCTTNCAAPMLKVLQDAFGIERAMLTTAHAYTSTQELLDDASKNEARSRAASLSIVPTTTGAADAVARVLPELKGKIDGLSLRVPVPVASFTDLSVVVAKQVSVEEVHAVFKKAAEGPMKGILGYEHTVLVSSDYIGNTHSCTYDDNYTKVVDGTLVKVAGWYDNEWGYSSRLVDLVERLDEKGALH